MLFMHSCNMNLLKSQIWTYDSLAQKPSLISHYNSKIFILAFKAHQFLFSINFSYLIVFMFHYSLINIWGSFLFYSIISWLNVFSHVFILLIWQYHFLIFSCQYPRYFYPTDEMLSIYLDLPDFPHLQTVFVFQSSEVFSDLPHSTYVLFSL